MPASFDGNDGNDGNAANSGGGGNSSSTSAGWFFADRVNLPFVTQPDTWPLSLPTPIGALNVSASAFPDRDWTAEWYSWLALIDFVQHPPATNWTTIPTVTPLLPLWAASTTAATGNWSPVNAGTDVQKELDDLVTAAQNERADAMAEILSQADEFISYFLNTMTARPGAYPATTKVLGIASLVGTFVAMYFKVLYKRPRPTQLRPALRPPIEVPGHASFPSGHSTQAHLMALCMQDVFKSPPRPLASAPQEPNMTHILWTLADSIARNREIAGLHYASDTEGGRILARAVHGQLQDPSQVRYQQAVTQARGEWP